MIAKNKNLKLAAAVATVLTAVAPLAAHAVTLPATSFTTVVTGGGATSGVCGVGTATDGICTATNGSTAHTDGGVPGTPGYDPSAASGTHVSVGATGFGASSLSTMTYYFEVGGPPVPSQYQGLLAVDIVSSGAASLTGAGISFASLIITDSGSDADIPAGTPDPDKGLVVDNRYDCVGSACLSSGAAWTQTDQLSGDHLCLTQGDVYAITITTGSSILSKGGTGAASIDPKIIVDPQGPTDPAASCYQPSDPSMYEVSVSGGASTGVPEPGSLGLMGLGLFGLGFGRQLSRRARQQR